MSAGHYTGIPYVNPASLLMDVCIDWFTKLPYFEGKSYLYSASPNAKMPEGNTTPLTFLLSDAFSLFIHFGQPEFRDLISDVLKAFIVWKSSFKFHIEDDYVHCGNWLSWLHPGCLCHAPQLGCHMKIFQASHYNEDCRLHFAAFKFSV